VEPDASDFSTAVDGWVLAVADSASPAFFDELVRLLPGVYPTEALASVQRLAEGGLLDAQTVDRLLRRAPERASSASVPSNLPVPHPLDFDWRFGQDTIDRLVSACTDAAGADGIVLIGAPSILRAMQMQPLSQPCLLLDANPAAVAALVGASHHRAQLCDIQHDALPPAAAGAVLLDPPWYAEHVRLFLWAAAQVCRPGATVMISLPGKGTRPGAPEERTYAIRWGRYVGLELVSYEEGALGYVSPPFERNALRTAGLTRLPEDWRRGDLLTFRAAGGNVVARPIASTAPRWPEVTVGRVRIRVRAEAGGGAVVDPRLMTVVEGDILDSVSRRDPRRAQIDVWTSGNRVFATRTPCALMLLAGALSDDGDVVEHLAADLGRSLTQDEKRNTLVAVDQLTELTATEAAELVSMGWSA
jgi:hypothetical protein